MAYRVILQVGARFDLFEAAAYIAEQERSTVPARRWISEMKKAIAELKGSLTFFGRISEEFDGFDKLHEIHRHSHRTIYLVDEAQKTVSILSIYHINRGPMTAKRIELD